MAMILRRPPRIARSQFFSGISQRRTYIQREQNEIPPTLPPKDFRPPWVFSVVNLGLWVASPVVGFYCIFMYDFGDRDHVFQPARRWVEGVKQDILGPPR